MSPHIDVERALWHEEDDVIQLILAAMGTYSDWCPGWRPPADAESFERARFRQNDRGGDWLVARRDERVVGVARWIAGEPAGLSLLMVDRSSWGSTVASDLHHRTLELIAASGSQNARLTVPLANLRARRFYERHRWRGTAANPHMHQWLGLRMLEYTRAL
jgi:hypothetical protein